tara:strand:+ start:1160 stop:1327 length:168 start_codon:yes stop_codon:yes gene_type:complete
MYGQNKNAKRKKKKILAAGKKKQKAATKKAPRQSFLDRIKGRNTSKKKKVMKKGY